MGIHNYGYIGNPSTVAPMALGESPVLLSGEGLDWYHFCVVGLSPLCHWLYYRVAADKAADKTVKQVKEDTFS